MVRTNSVGVMIARLLLRMIGFILMIMIGAVQAVGTIITAISAVILKGISALMIFTTILLLFFGLFTWTRTLVVLAIAGSMFWIPELLAAVVFGLSTVQAKLMDLMDT